MLSFLFDVAVIQHTTLLRRSPACCLTHVFAHIFLWSRKGFTTYILLSFPLNMLNRDLYYVLRQPASAPLAIAIFITNVSGQLFGFLQMDVAFVIAAQPGEILECL